MLRLRNNLILIPSLIVLILISGCDERVARLATQAADRQANQNQTMAELQKTVAAERARLDGGWTDLEQQRQTIAADRRTESLLVPALRAGGFVVLLVVLLGFCWYVLLGARSSGPSDAELSDLLIRDVFAKEPRLLPGPRAAALPSSLPVKPPAD